jgi:molybdopterin-guanine dinucleotide biosynthesis protein A
LLQDGFDERQAEIDRDLKMLTMVIQAGGESRRMGSDKALLPFLGQPMILRLLHRLAGIADEILVTSNHPENYRFLGLSPIADMLPGYGALGGLYTALSAAGHPYVAVVACDMPFASPELFAEELLILRQTSVDAVIPRLESGAEPFHAVYRRDTCSPYIRAALDAGKRRMDAWFSQANIHYLAPEEILLYDPDQLAFLNINTLEELRKAEMMARESDLFNHTR